MMDAAFKQGVKKYLFTSSIGVYSPAEVFREDDVWRTFPSPHDKFSGWAKRMGELQAEAYKIEYGWDNISIVRPSNVFGPYDNFDLNSAMVIPSLIKRITDGENPLKVWGDGSAIRDFIYAEDVADGMLLAMDKSYTNPINLGSGTGVSIKSIVETIISETGLTTEIQWDTSAPTGDQIRLMDISRAQRDIGFVPKVGLEEGIRRTVSWYLHNKKQTGKAYNVFRGDRSVYR